MLPADRRAMTMVEVVIVLALMALLAALILPRLQAGDAVAADEQAKTTATAALDSALVVADAAGLGQLGGADLGEQTAAANPDLDIAAAGAASMSARQASVAAAGTRIAVAVRGDEATGACWYVWRDLAAPSGQPTVAHFVRSQGSTLSCDAPTALQLQRPGDVGGNWSSPQPVA